LADTLVFAVAAFLIIASAMMVVVNQHPIHSALCLVLTFLGLSIFFLQLHAPFIAAVQIIVYAGAIMVLFLFVIMLLGEDKPLKGENKLGLQLPLGILFAVILAAQIGYLLVQQPQLAPPSAPSPVLLIDQVHTASFGSVQALGNTLYTDYLFAFEATSVVLLIAMVGVVVLAKKRL
jgi:NADH-quinone oxidoreductase subunit J